MRPQRSDWKVTALSPHSRQIEDSLVNNAAWNEKIGSRARDIIAGENRNCPFEWLLFLFAPP